MQYTETLGIDVSKDTLDCKIYSTKAYLKVENNEKGYKKLINWTIKNCVKFPLFCLENTGAYSLNLALYLSSQEFDFAMVNALEIKRSLGITRGKNDKIDAYRIAEYAYLRRDLLELTQMPGKLILRLKKLLSIRDHFVKQSVASKNLLKNLEQNKDTLSLKPEIRLVKKSIKELKAKITSIEKSMLEEISQDQESQEKFQLLQSIMGIGKILAFNLIVSTNGFLSFRKPREFACYAGVAPFKSQSGTSINSKSSVSPLANKKLKPLLNMAAISAIQHDPELKIYYQRKVESGKSKMSVLNAVRNKLVHRAFAVVKRGTPYVIQAKHAA